MSFFEVVVQVVVHFFWSRIVFPARQKSQKSERNSHTLSRAVGLKVVVFWWSKNGGKCANGKVYLACYTHKWGPFS